MIKLINIGMEYDGKSEIIFSDSNKNFRDRNMVHEEKLSLNSALVRWNRALALGFIRQR